MDLSQKVHVKLAPLNGVVSKRDRNRLKGGCTNLMYACQQGLTDTIVEEVRSQVNTPSSLPTFENRELFYNLKAQMFICQLNFQECKQFFLSKCGNWVMVVVVRERV